MPFALAQELDTEVKFKELESNRSWNLKTEELKIRVTKQGDLIFADNTGNVFKRDYPPDFQGRSWKLKSWLRDQESIHGLGLRAAGLNLRPGSYKMWNTDPGGTYGPGTDSLYLCIPVFIGRHQKGCYLVFFENSFDSRFTFKEKSSLAEFAFSGGPVRYYVIPGPLPKALKRYADLTGRSPMPPRWALGFHQSRWGYHSQKELQKIISGFLRRDLPLSAVHLDIDYMRGYRVFTVDRRRFPNLKDLSKELAENDVRLVSIIDPGIKKDSRFSLFQEGRSQGLFCFSEQGKPIQARVWPGWCVFPDYLQEKARTWWGKQYKFLRDLGISGFWHDMNEPATFKKNSAHTLTSNTRHLYPRYSTSACQGYPIVALILVGSAVPLTRNCLYVGSNWLLFCLFFVITLPGI